MPHARLFDDLQSLHHCLVRVTATLKALLETGRNPLIERIAQAGQPRRSKKPAEYSESDVLARALADCAEADPNGRVTPTEWHQVFVAWCKAAGERELTPRELGLAMRARGIVQIKSMRRYWSGFKLTRTAADFVDPATGEPRHALPAPGGASGAPAPTIDASVPV